MAQTRRSPCSRNPHHVKSSCDSSQWLTLQLSARKRWFRSHTFATFDSDLIPNHDCTFATNSGLAILISGAGPRLIQSAASHQGLLIQTPSVSSKSGGEKQDIYLPGLSSALDLTVSCALTFFQPSFASRSDQDEVHHYPSSPTASHTRILRSRPTGPCTSTTHTPLLI